MRKVTRIGVFSLAKIMGGVGLVFGFICGVIFSLVSLLGVPFAIADGGAGAALGGLIFGMGSIVVLPLIYGVFSFLQGLVVALIANLAMKLFGGLELELT